MLDGQLRPNKISTAHLLQRFAEVPREFFVSAECKQRAYCDEAVAQSAERQLMQPLVQASLIQALDLQATDTVLIAAGGCGYSAAIIAPLVQHVVVVEEDARLIDRAQRAIMDCGQQKNIEIVQGNPAQGAANTSFDKILLDAAAGEVPPAVLEQLKAGGKLAGVVAGSDGVMEAVVLTKQGKTYFQECLFETKGDILPNFAVQERFVF